MRQRENENPTSAEIVIYTLEINVTNTVTLLPEISTLRLYAVSFPETSLKQAMIFWRLTGLGISSRLAEDCLESLDGPRAVAVAEALALKEHNSSQAFTLIRTRIAKILNNSSRSQRVNRATADDDVYLYPSGMAAIYYLHQTLFSWRSTPSVVFGFPYELTLKMLDTYGSDCKFFAFATNKELGKLQAHLEAQSLGGRGVQAIWCECPSNPLLRTPDFDRLRQLADQYEVVLIVDETIGGFANVDLLDVADILVTSLTKSFSGYSNVMGGSVVLNPSSPLYPVLKPLFQSSYRNELYLADALQLERNSRDFLRRTAQVNMTTLALVNFFQNLVSDASSHVTAVYHPSTCWSIENYRNRMRPRTKDFEPGYGGVFTLEFSSVTAARIFFDASKLHKGPSLGANVTLLQPYVQTVFYKEKDWAARHGLKESIIRVSVGLEDQEALLNAFKEPMHVLEATLGKRASSAKLRNVDIMHSLPWIHRSKSDSGKEHAFEVIDGNL
ncbi:MAG: hypothetical protein Q9201_000834 [Fulgogasparrea decipioides]